jgi:hypothetical protein
MLTLVALVVFQLNVELCRRKMEAGCAENCKVGAAFDDVGGLPPWVDEEPPPAQPTKPLMIATQQNKK